MVADPDSGDEDLSDDTSPLDDIFVDDSDVNERQIASILSPYATIGSDSGHLHTTDEYNDLKSADKILVTLVAQRAKTMRETADTPTLGPSSIAELGRIKENTAKPKVRELAEEGLITDADDGYRVDPPQLQRILERLDIDE